MWFYSTPRKIVFGEDSLDELDQLNGNSILIVTDKVLLDLNIPQKVIEKLKNKGMKITIFSELSLMSKI